MRIGSWALRAGKGELWGEVLFIVDALLRSSLWGTAACLAFCAWAQSAPRSASSAGLLDAGFAVAYGLFYLGFAGAALASLGRRLAWLALGLRPEHAAGRSGRLRGARAARFGLEAGLGLALASVAAGALAAVPGGSPAQAWPGLALLASASGGFLAFGVSALGEGRREVRAACAGN